MKTKINATQASDIRELVKMGMLTKKKAAKVYSVSRTTIQKICSLKIHRVVQTHPAISNPGKI